MTKGKSRSRAAQKSFMRNFAKKMRARLQYDQRQYDGSTAESEES
jgi:hypothetical protein